MSLLLFVTSSSICIGGLDAKGSFVSLVCALPFCCLHYFGAVNMQNGPTYPHSRPHVALSTGAVVSTSSPDDPPFFGVELAFQFGQSLAEYFYDNFIMRFFPMEDERDL